MKTATIVSALLVAVAGVFSPSIAEASCQNICVRGFNDCLASGTLEADCRAELTACLNDCVGGGSVGELALNDDDARVSARSCVVENEASTTGRALLALLLEPSHSGVRASRAR